MDMGKREFIVAYNSDSCRIERFIPSYKYCLDLLHMYNFALKKHAYEYGDIVPWNNQFWCVVKAENCKEAFDIFGEKLKGRRKKV